MEHRHGTLTLQQQMATYHLRDELAQFIYVHDALSLPVAFLRSWRSGYCAKELLAALPENLLPELRGILQRLDKAEHPWEESVQFSPVEPVGAEYRRQRALRDLAWAQEDAIRGKQFADEFDFPDPDLSREMEGEGCRTISVHQSDHANAFFASGRMFVVIACSCGEDHEIELN